jgi:hypothetical protein
MRSRRPPVLLGETGDVVNASVKLRGPSGLSSFTHQRHEDGEIA